MSSLGLPYKQTHGWVRPVPRSFGRQASSPVSINIERAQKQHQHYCTALKDAGLTLKWIPGAPDLPDSVFIEDPVVLCGSRGLLTPMQNHRVGGARDAGRTLSATHDLKRLAPPGYLEGGDVLHLPDRTLVGDSPRTNDLGRKVLAHLLPDSRPIEPVALSGLFHLKSGATYMGGRTVLVNPRGLDPAVFDGYRILSTAPGEEKAANVLRIQQTLLVPAGYPHTQHVLEEWARNHHVQVRVLDVSEFEKVEGSLTCLSDRQ